MYEGADIKAILATIRLADAKAEIVEFPGVHVLLANTNIEAQCRLAARKDISGIGFPEALPTRLRLRELGIGLERKQQAA
jgi:hypothetical protein